MIMDDRARLKIDPYDRACYVARALTKFLVAILASIVEETSFPHSNMGALGKKYQAKTKQLDDRTVELEAAKAMITQIWVGKAVALQKIEKMRVDLGKLMMGRKSSYN
ncbi:hypothetical protein STAS_06689 [Striga asiatica]|uniref:Uncharacterized protein n=1 Tax=Striga asiatica TaxID=4170 RepID=A0A5A7PDG3_STRAF|nr:hypothetical protein STAS_06689 [Striga asiatica]